MNTSEQMNARILVTGGAGYIGSHIVVQLLEAGFAVTVFDNLANSDRSVIARIRDLTGKPLDFVEGDIRDCSALRATLAANTMNAVIHLAGLKSVAESEAQPLMYYDNNVHGSLVLLEEMALAGVRKIIYSSSATVYGNPGYSQYREDTPLAPVNVYGRSKLMVEEILCDLKKSQPAWSMVLLRYFNPIGAHSSGVIGENPKGVPNNLMPFIAQVAAGQREKLFVFGNQYPTPDGTGLRDYIHVDDLAAGHLAALRHIKDEGLSTTVNLGTGRPSSVLEVIRAFEKASGRPIPYEVVASRAGDLPAYYADPSLARTILGWQAQHSLDRMCEDAWRWQLRNDA